MTLSTKQNCDQCSALMINGVFCHEMGCPNADLRYDAESDNWIAQRKCFDCGCMVDADDPCCSAEPEPMEHFHYGSGEHGCLYDNGPHYTLDYQAAVDCLAETFELGRTRKAQLKKDGYLELNPRRDGASYCEITSCSDDCKEEDYE